MQLVELENNGLLVTGKFDEPVYSIEEGIGRIREIKQDYERIVETVTERKFHLEGKTLYEMRDTRKETRDWEKQMELLVEQGVYSSNHQIRSLIKKYETFSNLHLSGESYKELEKLNIKEMEQLQNLKLSEAKAILESENAKLELKKLRVEKEQMKRDREVDGEEIVNLRESLKHIEDEKKETEDSLEEIGKEISQLSRQLNNRPTIEVEKIVEKIVEIEKSVEVIPNDYAELKAKAKEYEDKIREMETKKNELATRLAKNVSGVGLAVDIRSLFIGKENLRVAIESGITIFERALGTEVGDNSFAEYSLGIINLKKSAKKLIELIEKIDKNNNFIEAEVI